MMLSQLLLTIGSPQHQGFVGVYHAATGNVADGHNTTSFDVGNWGIVSPVNAPSDGPLKFKDDLVFHCQNKSINALWGMVIANTEGGIFSNPNDTDPFVPLAPSRSHSDPRGQSGMLQGAARWSALSRTFCPQIAGIVVDDFWTNFDPNAPPPSPPPAECVECPSKGRTHMYGTMYGGFYCCAWPATGGHCEAPPGVPAQSSCCLFPGYKEGCQSLDRCGNNPKNVTPCGAQRPLNVAAMRDLKAALAGKELLPDGTVNHSSPVTTPHLRLMAVTYDVQIPKLNSSVLIKEGLVDAISYWIEGPRQRTLHANLTSMVKEMRAALGPTFPIYTGGYVTYSSIGWTQPAPFYDLLNQSIALYDANLVSGFFLFAGTVLSKMNASLWREWDLPGHLSPYFQRLGSAELTVTDATTQQPIRAVVASVSYGPNRAHVTRKLTSATGLVKFGGWTGRAKPVAHLVQLEAEGYAPLNATVQLEAGATSSIRLAMRPKGVSNTGQPSSPSM